MYLRFCLLAALLAHHASAQRYKTIYQKIQQEPRYSGFNALVRGNRVAKLNLHYDQLTVFAPENNAINEYGGDLYSDLAFYHMTFEVKTLQQLQSARSVATVDSDNPPLWFTAVDEDIYVNDAKILKDRSNLVSMSRSGSMGKQQVLHVIDKVLDPVIKSPQFSPDAYDFLSSADEWRLGAAKTVTKFFSKVQEYNLRDVYKRNGGHTFFVPLDSGVDSHKFDAMSRYVVFGHVVPYSVLFTRPTARNFAYESMADDDYAYVVLSFEERGEKLYVRGLAKGNLGGNNDGGEFYSEVVVPNIPVKNGVVHLISQPLAIFNRTLKPFPYLPIMEKISTDPTLDVFYTMGEKTEFNKVLDRDNVSFTYFVPADTAWEKTRSQNLTPAVGDVKLLGRHLVVSQSPYSMEQLYSLTTVNNYTDVELSTLAGPLRIQVLKIHGDFYIKWSGRYIKVLRPNYECTNGIVHILAGPITDFKKTSASGSGGSNGIYELDYKKYGDSLNAMWGSIF